MKIYKELPTPSLSRGFALFMKDYRSNSKGLTQSEHEELFTFTENQPPLDPLFIGAAVLADLGESIFFNRRAYKERIIKYYGKEKLKRYFGE